MNQVYNVIDVCRYIINYCHSKKYHISNLKLQKILYFTQAYFLSSHNNRKCFEEEIEAWDFGPVVPTAYREYLEFGSMNIYLKDTYEKLEYDKKKDTVEFVTKYYNTDVIDDKDKVLINRVVDEFANCSVTYLTQVTMNQKPFTSVYKQDEHNIIDTRMLREYFLED